MRIAFIQGFFSSSTRGPYRVNDLASHDLTGSESFFFNMVREVASLGHQVEAHGFWTQEHTEGNVHYIPFANPQPNTSTLNIINFEGYDAAVAWNEPDYLSAFSPKTRRICLQQLNDFSYCTTAYKDNTDLFLFPSLRHLEHMVAKEQLDRMKCAVLSNCISNEDNFQGKEDHNNHKIVYCSSPDRGVHWLAEFFPKVRQRVPDAELHIYYRIDPWLNIFSPRWSEHNPQRELEYRARYFSSFINRYGIDGKKGVFVHGPVSNKRMADTLKTARLLAYPCDTVLFTEGFGVSVLDACRAGTFPLISDVDAFGSVYKDAAYIIPGRPADNRTAWVDAICKALTDDTLYEEVTTRCRDFSLQFTRTDRAINLLKYLRSTPDKPNGNYLPGGTAVNLSP